MPDRATETAPAPPRDPHAAVLATMRDLEALPCWYRWGSKGPPELGLDCSGAVCWCLAAAGLVPSGFGLQHNADSLRDLCDEVDEEDAAPGDLALYGTAERAIHVMILCPDGRVLGAAGGGHTCTSIEIAKSIGARVKYRTTARYRSDFLGFGRLCL